MYRKSSLSNTLTFGSWSQWTDDFSWGVVLWKTIEVKALLQLLFCVKTNMCWQRTDEIQNAVFLLCSGLLLDQKLRFLLRVGSLITRLKRLSVLDREIRYILGLFQTFQTFWDFRDFLRPLGLFETFSDFFRLWSLLGTFLKVKLVLWHWKSRWR